MGNDIQSFLSWEQNYFILTLTIFKFNLLFVKCKLTCVIFTSTFIPGRKHSTDEAFCKVTYESNNPISEIVIVLVTKTA